MKSEKHLRNSKNATDCIRTNGLFRKARYRGRGGGVAGVDPWRGREERERGCRSLLSESIDETVQLRRVLAVRGSKRYPWRSENIDDQHQPFSRRFVERLVQLAVVENDDLAFDVVPYLKRRNVKNTKSHGKQEGRVTDKVLRTLEKLRVKHRLGRPDVACRIRPFRTHMIRTYGSHPRKDGNQSHVCMGWAIFAQKPCLELSERRPTHRRRSVDTRTTSDCIDLKSGEIRNNPAYFPPLLSSTIFGVRRPDKDNSGYFRSRQPVQPQKNADTHKHVTTDVFFPANRLERSMRN